MEVEDSKYFGICKCCLRDGCFRSMWVEYEVDGVVQNYGEMLNECFDLCWQQPDNSHLEQICDVCASHTRKTYIFRRLILQSQDRLNGVVRLDEESIDIQDTKQIYAEDISEDFKPVVKTEASELDYQYEIETLEYLDPEPESYEEVEYLELEVEKLENIEEPPTDAPPKRKWLKKKKRGERREYKQYSIDDVERSMTAVKTAAMTMAEAAAAYHIPRKTLAAKLLSEKRGELPKMVPNERNVKFIKEIQTLLTYTNMIPYKTKTAHLHCAYCSTVGPLFDDADELRTHTRTQHTDDRTKNVEQFLRPLWLNEVLKVDMENLHCTICCTYLTSWNDMFKHLTEQHNLEFDEAYTRVIPYILGNDWRCALCKESFPNYHHLDSHMNAHYTNYMCSECGDTFLAESRLKKHLQIHDTGRFQCEHCGKTFTLEKYRAKHIELVHKQNQKIRCLYCPEKFHGTYPRHLHVVAHHKEKVKIITCELCGKTFDWRPYYLAHKRRKHDNEKKYQCQFCDKQFFMKSEVIRHQMGHTGDKYSCDVCGKQFSSMWTLNVHYRSHGQERARPRLKVKDC
ncbi:hypothetical protein MSG28_014527 [Choristoneura fumiferana]|uniref:Uncharacterized protein n=1 Tax=Choristoneura fumiferana TaxID=7141 RepID=A0ACC0JRQ4_CHOFU|nr:hypothetical protein MSG28_014527 [Choristoneura fumiferana]